MIDDGIKGGNTDMALTDFLVAVFMAGQFVLAVVDVDGLQPVETDDLIEGQEDVVELMDDVVAAVKDVSCIEADADFIIHNGLIDDGRQFFKGPPDFRPLAGHGF